MKNIVKRQYRELCDFPKVYDFMVKNYTIDCRNGSCAPFFEYSLATPWFDNKYNHRFAIWEEDGEVVAFCWCESRLGQVFFNLSEGYEFLIPQMIEHAGERLRADGGKLQLKNANVTGIEDIYMYSGGTLEMKGGTLDTRNYLHIREGATATLDGVTVKDYIYNYGTLNLADVTSSFIHFVPDNL